MAFLETADARIAYEIVGDGERALILVNGHMRTRSDFRLMAKFFAERNFTVISFDNRGSGETISSGIPDITTFSEDITRLAAEHNLTSYFLLGISMGGLISMRHALDHSAKVEKLIVVSSTPKAQWIMPANHGSWGNTMEQVAEKMQAYVAPEYAKRNRLLIQAMAKQILGEIQNNNFVARSEQQRIVVDKADLTPELGALKNETLILHGALDQIISPDAARELARLIPRTELEIVPEIGHLFLAENPRFLYDRVLQFVSN